MTGVIETVMSLLMAHWVRIEKATAQQVYGVCMCVCVSPDIKSFCTDSFSN